MNVQQKGICTKNGILGLVVAAAGIVSNVVRKIR